MKRVLVMLACLLIIWSVPNRGYCVPSDADQKTKDRIARDIQLLYSKNERQRDAAVQDLLHIGRAAVPQLIGVLRNYEHPQFERALRPAAFILGELKATESIHDLVALLGTGTQDVMVEYNMNESALAEIDPVFQPLVRMGEPAVPELKKQLIIAHWPRAFFMLRALKAIGTPAAIEVGRGYADTLNSYVTITRRIFGDLRPEN